MIARLVGRVVARDGGRAVLDVRDVGYAVHGPTRDIDAWATSTEPVVVWVSTDVREDAITLFGFGDDLDRVTFERLRSVEGIGPKVALASLDALGRERLVSAVERDDLAALSSIPGVGKKLAQRMALELKGKLPASFSPTSEPVAPVKPDDGLSLALARLGYTRTEIVRAEEALAKDATVGPALADRVRAALRVLSGG